MFRRIRSIFFSLFGGRAITLLKNVFIIPILVKVWGLEYYGEWVLISSVISVLGMTNVGLGTASQLLIIKFLNRKNLSRANNVLTHSILITVVFFVFFILLIALAYVLGLIHFKLINNGLLVFVALTTAYFTNLVTKPLRGYWIFHKKYNVSAWYDNIQGLGELLSLTVIPLLGKSGLWVGVTTFLVNIAWTSWYFYQSRKRFHSSLSYTPDSNLIKVIVNKGLGFQFSALWQAILYQIPLWIIGFKLNASYVGIWGSLRAFTRIGNQIIELISLTIGSEFQILVSKRNLDKVTSMVFNILQISLVVSFGAFLFLWFWGKQTYSIWIHVEAASKIDDRIWVVMGLGLILFSLWRISYEIPVAMNKPWRLNLFGVLFSVTSCIVTYFSLGKFGLLGVAVGTVVFDFLMAVYLPYNTFKTLGVSSLSDLKSKFNTSFFDLKKKLMKEIRK